VLEIASGSGQHAAYFARELPRLEWQPSDIDPQNLASISSYVREAGLSNLREPRELDVLDADWKLRELDAIFCANMIHIAPFACCEGLLRGAGVCLLDGGVLVIYGPFRLGGEHTSESNQAFDASLRARDPRWGVRDAEEVIALGERAGLVLEERVAMPANNQTLVLRRQPQ
jgi:hypothetical protein